jgi:hypothetical protein
MHGICRGLWILAGACGLLLGGSGCGYTLEGRGVFLPQHIQRVYIPVFENKSYEPGVGVLLTTEVIEEVQRRGGVRLVQEESGADAVLRGTVMDYRLDILSTDQEGQVSAYRVSIQAQIVFYDLVQKRAYWENTLSKVQDFPVQESAASTQVLEREAIEEAAEDFAKTIVAAIFLGF